MRERSFVKIPKGCILRRIHDLKTQNTALQGFLYREGLRRGYKFLANRESDREEHEAGFTTLNGLTQGRGRVQTGQWSFGC